MAEPITTEIANRVWDILVSDLGASKHRYARAAFVSYAVERSVIPEYRFIGKLGFGGKVRFRDRKWSVYYYDEDRTQGRDALEQIANKHLAELSN